VLQNVEALQFTMVYERVGAGIKIPNREFE
jgi:hypothetical protein